MNDSTYLFPLLSRLLNIYMKKIQMRRFYVYPFMYFSFFIPLLTAIAGYAEGTAAVKDVSEKLQRGFLRIDSLFTLKEYSLCFRNNSKWRYLE